MAESDLPLNTSRQRLLRIGYALFFVAVVVFCLVGLRGRWDDIGRAMSEISPARWTGGLALVTVGLFPTSGVWFLLMTRHGARIPLKPALVTFFVGQLGKYIPGSLWSMGAQAEMARRHDTPARVTVSAGLVFVGVNVASAGGLGSIVALIGGVDTTVPRVLFVLAAVGGPLVCTPPVLNRIGAALAPASHPLRFTWADSAVAYLAMAVTWFIYGTALSLLVGTSRSTAESGDLTLLVTTAAFSLAYVVGVVVIIAPAGVGAREASMVAILTPYVGLERSVAAALMVRVLHTIADFTVALGAWLVAGSSLRPALRSDHPDQADTTPASP
jgi:uncharacterized membrane protein YbhN (UPF0104 family)